METDLIPLTCLAWGGDPWKTDPTNLVLLDHFQRTLLYAVTNWQSYMPGVSGVGVISPADSSPPGCLLRFVSFIGNPGASVCQVELRKEEGNEYVFWIHSVKVGLQTYSNKKFVLNPLIFLVFRLVQRWLETSPDKFKRAQNNANLEQFMSLTGVRDFQPQLWTTFEAVLHHCVYLASDAVRRHVDLWGWTIDFQEGEYLYVSQRYSQKCEYYSAIRGAVTGFMNGSLHTRGCPSSDCRLCIKHHIQTCANLSPDTLNLVLLFAMGGEKKPEETKP